MGNDCQYNEKELLAKIAQGDEKAFTQLIADYAPIIYSHILTYIKDVPQAEELTQDIFVGIWKLRITLPSIENFRAYIFKSAKNRTISALRQQLDHVPLGGRDDWEDVLANPAATTELRELTEAIHEGIELLPPRRKQVFKMSRLEGLSYDEIASQLNISRSAVNQHIVESLLFLRGHLHNKMHLWIALFLPLLHPH